MTTPAPPWLSLVAFRPQYEPCDQSAPLELLPANSGITMATTSSGCSDQELDHSTPLSCAATRVVWMRREYSVTYSTAGTSCTAATAAPATAAPRKSPKRSPAA